MLDRLLALNCSTDIVVPFKINELLQSMTFRKAGKRAGAMFVAAPNQIAGDADVKRTIATVAHDVNKTAIHHAN